MAPSTLMQFTRRAKIYAMPALLLFLIATPLVSASIRSAPHPFLSCLASYPVSFRPCIFMCSAFFTYLIFYYTANKKSYHSRLYILSASLLFLAVHYLLPFLFDVVLPRFCSLTPRIQGGVGVFLLASLILQPHFTSLHLFATSLILILILVFYSLLLLLPAASVEPSKRLSVLLFLYYFPTMPNFFLSFAPIIRRTMATCLFFFLILTPQLVTFFRLMAAHVLIFLLTPQTQRVNYVVRRLHGTGSIDYVDAEWFIALLSWSFCALYLICNAAKSYIHTTV